MIDEKRLIRKVNQERCAFGHQEWNKALARVVEVINQQPKVESQLPCKIGDVAYGIRCYKGVNRVQKGFVHEMFYTKEMRLLVSIKHVCLGEWGEKIFGTEEEALQALSKKGQHGYE